RVALLISIVQAENVPATRVSPQGPIVSPNCALCGITRIPLTCEHAHFNQRNGDFTDNWSPGNVLTLNHPSKRYARTHCVRCSVEYGQKAREATQASGVSRQKEGETVGT